MALPGVEENDDPRELSMERPPLELIPPPDELRPVDDEDDERSEGIGFLPRSWPKRPVARQPAAVIEAMILGPFMDTS